MAYSAGSVAEFVFTRMTGISSEVSGSMVKLASGAIIDIGNFVGETLDCVNVPEKWFNAAVNLTALFARGHLDGGAVTIGTDGISISKGMSPQAELFASQVNNALKRKKVLYTKVY